MARENSHLYHVFESLTEYVFSEKQLEIIKYVQKINQVVLTIGNWLYAFKHCCSKYKFKCPPFTDLVSL